MNEKLRTGTQICIHAHYIHKTIFLFAIAGNIRIKRFKWG